MAHLVLALTVLAAILLVYRAAADKDAAIYARLLEAPAPPPPVPAPAPGTDSAPAPESPAPGPSSP